MLITEARRNLERLAAGRGIDLATMNRVAAMDLLLDWYRNERATDAGPLSEDGDGLLFQYGTWPFSGQPMFHYDLTTTIESSPATLHVSGRRPEAVTLAFGLA